MVYLYNIRGISPWDVHGGEEDKKNGIYYHYFKERERERERRKK